MGPTKRKSNNIDKYDHGQEKRRPSTYVEEKSVDCAMRREYCRSYFSTSAFVVVVVGAFKGCRLWAVVEMAALCFLRGCVSVKL